MPLYSYKKAPFKTKPANYNLKHDDTLEVKRRRFTSITLGEILRGAYHDFNRLMTTSKLAAMFVPAILVVLGVSIIYGQVWPTVLQTIQEKSGYFDDDTAALVAGTYIEAKQQYSNPGSKYFASLTNSAKDQNLLFNDPKSSSYTQDFSLSIPSLNLYDIKVKSNVDSSVEEVYDAMLKDGLGHFAGTSLPFEENGSYNTVIYGHSSSGDYYQRTKDPAAAFSLLSQLRYGNEIILKFDGKELKYKFIKGRIVGANDMSILQGSGNRKMVTLFTCYPNGNNNKRFVATATLIDD